MTLSRWSMSQLLVWTGTAALVVLFVPVGLYLTQSVVSFAERRLSERGQSLARTLAGQIVDPILLEDRVALHDALRKAAGADAEARYLCLVDAQGRVMAHTFDRGFPVALAELWQRHEQEVIRFRTSDEPLLDISAPILSGQLGTLHVGVSRAQAVRARWRAMWVLGAALVGGLGVLLLGAHFVAARVSRPLQQLEAEVSRLPDQIGPVGEDRPRIGGTREVEALAKGFGDMAERLATLEHDRATTQQRMIHAERLAALGELAAGLAHEIHNPLDGMLECVRYLKGDPHKSERTAKYLPMLRDGLERIAGVMRHMLTLARSGHNVPVQVRAAADIVDALVLMTQSQLDTRQVRLTVQQAGSCACFCNANALLQAMLNLVLNACDAVEGREEPEIRIEAQCDHEWVYLTIEDSGAGVPEELRHRIFDPFFTTRPAGKGTGLGLSISRQLVRGVGGELELSPEPSRLGGACFVIRLPRAAEAECCDESSEDKDPRRG